MYHVKKKLFKDRENVERTIYILENFISSIIWGVHAFTHQIYSVIFYNIYVL